MPTPSREDLASFAEFIDVFDSEGFSWGEIHTEPPQEDGTLVMPWPDYSDMVSRWHNALYERHVIDGQSDYLSEALARRMHEFAADPSSLSACDLPTIRTVLTYIARGERFCDGHMAEYFDNGVAQAATRRLVELSG